MGLFFDKLELYIKYPPIRVKDTYMKELEKSQFVSTVMTIAPELNNDRENVCYWNTPGN